jgi:hypothetical protein
MKPYESTCSFYRIRERTKNEFVSVGSTGSVVRWSETKGSEQLWLPVPVEGGKVKFMVGQVGHLGECMAVGSDGNVVRWASTGKPEQVFELVNPTDDGWWEIEEGTKGERVAVGSTGNILRWERSGGKDQMFKLEPWRPAKKPPLEKGETGPGEIGDTPRIVSFEGDLPAQSEVHLISETHLPATVVQDAEFSDVTVQVERTPYYILRREQFWDRSGDRGFSRYHAGKTEEVFERTFRYLVTNTAGRSSETVLGLEFGVKGGYSRMSKSAGSISLELSTKISRELKTTEYQEGTIERELSYLYRQTFPVGEPFRLVAWTLVDRYTVMRTERTPIAVWEVALDNTSVVDGFPRPHAGAFRSQLRH